MRNHWGLIWKALALAVAATASLCDPVGAGAWEGPAQPRTAGEDTPEKPGPSDWVDLFGTNEGKPIDTGFVFYDGRYVEAPYRVSRRGVGLYVNQTRLPRSGAWPPTDYEDKDPGVPPGLTRDSTFADLDFKDKPGDSWDRKKVRWLRRHYSPEEAQRLIVRYYEELPFVAKVELLPQGRLQVTTHAGKTVTGEFAGFPPYFPPTKEQTLKELERVRGHLEERLEKGDCFFLFTGGSELSFARHKAAKDLPLAIEVLSSARTAAEKTDLMQRMYILPSGPEQFQTLVTRFQPSAQLTERVRALVEKTGVKPRTMDEVPEEPDWRIEQRMKELWEKKKADRP